MNTNHSFMTHLRQVRQLKLDSSILLHATIATNALQVELLLTTEEGKLRETHILHMRCNIFI